MSFTYEQIEQLSKSVLSYYCNHKYELHDLVNSVWIAGRAQKAAKVSHCICLIRYDAIVYIRSCEGRIVAGRKQGKSRLSFKSIEAIRERRSYIDDPSSHIIAAELREHLLRGMTSLEKLVTTMSWEDFNLREIAPVAGCSESNVSIVRTRTRKMCREKIRHYCRVADRKPRSRRD